MTVSNDHYGHTLSNHLETFHESDYLTGSILLILSSASATIRLHLTTIITFLGSKLKLESLFSIEDQTLHEWK